MNKIEGQMSRRKVWKEQLHFLKVSDYILK